MIMKHGREKLHNKNILYSPNHSYNRRGTCQKNNSYALDQSAIIHLASMRKDYTNTFRIAVTLKEMIDDKILQQVMRQIVPRFPTVFAGIHPGLFQYRIIPARKIPKVTREKEILCPMSKAEIRNCGVRILYNKNRIIGEFFHSLTDGYGGMVVMNTLVAEYLRQKEGIMVSVSPVLSDKNSVSCEAEERDDYLTYANVTCTKQGKPALKRKAVYQLSGKKSFDNKIRITTQNYKVEDLKKAAKAYHVSVTAFLGAVLMETIMELQENNSSKGFQKRSKKMVQIMVPVDLRRLFSSETLRNFSLFVLVENGTQEKQLSFKELVHRINAQLKAQRRKDDMAAAMATYTRAERFLLYRILPLPVKWLLLRLAHQLFGERNSCITLSNLGALSLPWEMRQWVEGIEFALTPRMKSAYNCGVVSYGKNVSVCFSRTCQEQELERIFKKKIEEALQPPHGKLKPSCKYHIPAVRNLPSQGRGL